MTVIEAGDAPSVQFGPLHRADGSASFHDRLYSILVAVDGPIEVQRRDELPEEAAIEVNVRPLSGVGGPRERWLEEVIQSLLKNVVLVHTFPRTLVQVTLQSMKEPETHFTAGRGEIGIIASLVNASMLGLIDAGLPLRTTTIAGLAVVTADDRVVTEPGEKELASSKSVHAMAYDKDGNLLLDESLGTFNYTRWEEVSTIVQDLCIGALRNTSVESDTMELGNDRLLPWFRQALEEKVRQANAWREAT